MNLEQVAHYIAHPHELGLAEAPALKSMSEKHPYAAVFSLLYLTALANGKSVDLDDALQQHAYKLSDRTKLYHLLHGSQTDLAIDNTEATLLTPPSREDALTSPFGGGMRGVTESIPNNDFVTEKIIEETLPEEPVNTVADQEKEHTGATLLIPPSREEEEQLSLEDTPRPETDFDRITEAFTREQHFEVEFHEEDQVAEPENVVVAEESAAEEEVAVPEEITEEILPLSPPPKGETERASQPEQKRSFTSWLKSGDHTAEAQAEADTSPAERATLVVPVSQQAEPEPLKRKVDDIIDNFIKEEPTITRGKTEFFSPSRKAKESLDEEAVPVSETLAKIFAAQGNYPKAIHVYHQLMLSFPEKKSFFAIQIEALKKKITP